MSSSSRSSAAGKREEPQERVPTVLHKLEYAALRGVAGVVLALPERLGLGACAALGWFSGAVLRARRGTVDRNLKLAFPDAAPGWRGRVARAAYAHLGRETGVMLRTALAGPERTRDYVLERTRLADTDSERTFQWLRERSAAGKGSLVVTGHLGNWEMGGSALAARGLPLTAVAVGQANPLIDRRLREARKRLGMDLLGKSEAATAVRRSLEAGRVVALVGDQNARGAGVLVPFFGRRASTARGAALFALRADVPLLLGVAAREPGPPQRYRIFLRRISESTRGDLRDDVLALTAAHTAALEDHVRKFPEQYLWHHKRWRSLARFGEPEEPPPDGPVLPESGGREPR